MPNQQTEQHYHTRMPNLPGLDAEATPLVGVGLGLTGLALGLRPRLAVVPLVLTAAAALFYRDPHRATPDEPNTVFAPIDGRAIAVDEVYEHRFLHTDAIRIITVGSPFDVPISRSPVAGTISYVEQIVGEYRPISRPDAAETNTRAYIGLETGWGPVLVVHIAGPLSPRSRIPCRVTEGDDVYAGERIATARFGSRTDLLIQRDSIQPAVRGGQRVVAGRTPLARLMPL
ncbi:MAG: phosphatidylserine decarboxylase [Chloroflexaceae bacterium]|nr:phosphatidylserine decarboxylase [Chloroflexaceae bacterium]NJO05720.1 phosphatidylserine decarboxylase [Chloroflexaceae bacterium]